MNSKLKKILTGTMACAMMVSSIIPVCAESVSGISKAGGNGTSPVNLTADEAKFDVTVPLALTIHVDQDGKVTHASKEDTHILNNGYGPVIVKDVSIAGNAESGWSVQDFNTDLTKEKVGTKAIGFKINNEETDADGKLTYNAKDWHSIDGNGGTQEIEYDAKVPAQFQEITAATDVADVTFTIGWDLVE